MMKGKNFAIYKKRKSLDGDEKTVQKLSTENINTGFHLLSITGQQPQIKDEASEQLTDNKSHEHEINIVEDLNKRPLSDRGPIDKVVNLPKLHESNKSQDDSVNNRDTGTIRRPYEGNRVLHPLVIQAFSRNKPEEENHDKPEPTYPENLGFGYTDMDTETTNTSNEYIQSIKDNSISTFPPIEEEEIDKHRLMNEEAEKNNKSKAPPSRYQGYLKRLSLERKPLNDQKTKDLKLTKKKVLKRAQTKSKFVKEFKDDFFDEKPPTPPKPKETEAKPVKLILGFRYSYAVEQYYRGQMSHLNHEMLLRSEELDNSREEVLNGWLVKSLGPNVLNLRARTLPSCNPIEIRLRRQQARMRDLSRTRGLSRSWSRESGLSRAMLKSKESISKLHAIEEGRESRQSNKSLKEKKVVISQKVEVMGIGEQSDRSSVTTLPPIYSPDKVYSGVPKLKKAISLKLPVIGAEE